MSTLEQALSVRGLEIEQLKLQLAKLKRVQFGRESEKLDRKIEQLETRLENLVAEEGESEQQAAQTAPRRKSERLPLPEHLEREERILDPQEQACAQCGGELKPLGEDVSEQLEIIDSAFKVIRHMRRKKACACCDHIAQAAAPGRPIERGIAGAGLLAQILVAKFADHQQLYRQSAIYERRGVELDPSTMARWVGACGNRCARWSRPCRLTFCSQVRSIRTTGACPRLHRTMDGPKRDACEFVCAMTGARVHGSASGMVCLHAKSPGQTSSVAPLQFQRRAPS